MPERFGAYLRGVRRSIVVTVAWPYRDGVSIATTTGPMSQNELARRAGVNPALVHRLELGTVRPSFKTAQRLADALELAGLARAELLVVAGFWPWPELDDEQRQRVVGTAAAVVAGDYRRLDEPRAVDG